MARPKIVDRVGLRIARTLDTLKDGTCWNLGLMITDEVAFIVLSVGTDDDIDALVLGRESGARELFREGPLSRTDAEQVLDIFDLKNHQRADGLLS